MIQGHLNELRSVVERATDLPEETRDRLLQLTAQLEQDVREGGAAQAASSETTESSDETIANTAEPSGVTGLVSAIEGLETSHPEVTATVSNVARMLSKLGF
jgi:hypothetical protein